MKFELTRRRATVIIALVACAVYALSLFNMFAYDDVAVISLDKRIHSLSILRSIFSINYWNNEAQGLYRPLVTGSFAIDWAIASNHPGWYHFMNVLWNAAACVLALLLLAEFFPLAAALGAALIFTVHPVHVEAVANVVGRAELMAAVFMFGAALVWLRAASRRTILLAAPLLYMLALMSKESAIMLPPLLVLLDIAAGRLRVERFRAWVADRILPMAGLAAAAVAFLLLRAAVLPSLIPANLDAAIELVPEGLPRIYTALQVWPQYLRLLVFPVTLLADYGPRILLPQFDPAPPVVAGFFILAACVIAGLIAAWRGRGRTALALLWIPVALLPVSNLLFPIGTILAERTLYLPSFAIAVAVGATLAHVHANADPDGAQRRQRAWAILLLLVIACTVRTVVRIPDWKSTRSIFQAQIRSRPDSFRAQWHFARKAVEAKEPRKALELYGHTLRLWPHRARLLKESSAYAVRMKDLPFARQVNEQGVRSWPRDVDFRRSLAAIELDMGDSAKAAAHVRDGLAIAPKDSVLNAMKTALGHWTKAP